MRPDCCMRFAPRCFTAPCGDCLSAPVPLAPVACNGAFRNHQCGVCLPNCHPSLTSIEYCCVQQVRLKSLSDTSTFPCLPICFRRICKRCHKSPLVSRRGTLVLLHCGMASS